ncbi:hypothetical protein HK098_000913 [Nowakowskiella sp. JEL0407]|nr:hypothetical protein HK098_000913 [Nowakowskiella sp. JEL0407]
MFYSKLLLALILSTTLFSLVHAQAKIGQFRRLRRQLIGVGGIPQPPPGSGTQFITGACQADNDCASGCCEINQKKCRAPASLKQNAEFCGNGFTPNFDPSLNKKVTASPSPQAKKQVAKKKKQNNGGAAKQPTKGKGTQFITGPCAVDGDCASGCCEKNQKKCRAPLSLQPKVEFCGNGFTPNFDGGNQGGNQNQQPEEPASNNVLPPKGTGTQFITGPCSVDNDCASGCCEKNQKKCRAPLSLKPNAEFCGSGFTPNFDGPQKQAGGNDNTQDQEPTKPPVNNVLPPKGSGTQFITGPCSADSDCASGCCEINQKKCRAPLSLKPNAEFCGSGFTPNFDGPQKQTGDNQNAGETVGNNTLPPKGSGTQFITGPCSEDNDCASGCCEINQKKCRAPLSLKPKVEFCGNGFTPNFG